jgi:acetyl esterase/lipase
MRVKMSMVNKELRTYGRIFKLLNNTFTESRIRIFAGLTRKFLRGKTDKSLECTEKWILRDDNSPMRVCIFRSKEPSGNAPGILWLHGGGYGMGAPEQGIGMAKAFNKKKQCVMIAPDYRLSVDAPYPAALNDCYTALLWMKNNAESLGINDSQIFIGGDSAGGGLTVAISLYARDKNEVNIAFQMPLYPMLDDRMLTESATDNNAPVWNSKSNYNGWKLYLGELYGKDIVPEYAAPARATNYANLPPTATFVGDLEPFRDETILYVENLRKAGVKVSFRVFEGCYHAFEQMCPNAEISRSAIGFITSEYAYAVENYFAEQAI